MGRTLRPYNPTMPRGHVARLRAWHAAAYDEMRQRGPMQLSYLGTQLQIPETVFAPTPMSDLLGNTVLSEVREGDRVLDMGTGCGVNAILAASKSSDVVGVDINPDAVAAARTNAERNGVAERTRFFLSDVFNAVSGRFDLIVFDPPFRWFRPRDLLEASIADENYEALTRFFSEVLEHLESTARVLLSFGTTGDIGYLSELIGRAGLDSETLSARELKRDGLTATYNVYRLSVSKTPRTGVAKT